jgi:transcriptional regulator GlxA family with amidase domain
MQRPSTIEHRKALMTKALQLIEAEYYQSLDLDGVARRLATSRRQLQRCFAEHGDESFRECLARIRMQRAAELLRASPMPIGEVAQRVGYRQPPQFAKAFRRQHGVAPAQFRAARETPHDQRTGRLSDPSNAAVRPIWRAV